MSQCDLLHELFRENGNRLTLGQLLAAGPVIGSKYTNRISELRSRLKSQGYTIACHVHKDRPTENTYEIVPLEVPAWMDGNQRAFAI